MAEIKIEEKNKFGHGYWLDWYSSSIGYLFSDVS
jgi:hypothetical protein